jgi:glycosyltransferase involved in cell wall biosynthesis
VLHVIPALSVRIGGPAVSVVEASVRLDGLGVETTIFTTDMAVPQATKPRRRVDPSEFPSGAESLDVRVFPAQQPYRMAYSAALSRALKTEAKRFDVIHIHMLFHLPARAAFHRARKIGMPYIVSPVGSLDPKLRRRSRAAKAVNDLLWQRSLMDNATLIHYKTDEEQRLCEDLAFRAPSTVVPNGVDLAAFGRAAGGSEFRKRYLGGAQGPVVMNVGRIAYKKRLDRLIHAFATLRPTAPPTTLAIVGPDDEGLGAELTRLAGGLGVAERVFFTGVVNGTERHAALAAADVWVLPSDTENFGNAIVEAMAAGIPVVVTPGVNLSSSIEAGGAGRVCSTEPDSVAREIQLILDDPALAKQISSAGREFARRYDWDVVAPQLLAMYDDAVGTHAYQPSVAMPFETTRPGRERQ